MVKEKICLCVCSVAKVDVRYLHIENDKEEKEKESHFSFFSVKKPLHSSSRHTKIYFYKETILFC
jgi:hypothetical protein